MSYGVELSHQAKKTLKLLDKVIIRRIEKRLEELCLDPHDPPGHFPTPQAKPYQQWRKRR